MNWELAWRVRSGSHFGKLLDTRVRNSGPLTPSVRGSNTIFVCAAATTVTRNRKNPSFNTNQIPIIEGARNLEQYATSNDMTSPSEPTDSDFKRERMCDSQTLE